MKKLLFVLFLFVFGQMAIAQKVEWKELENFHEVMSQTFHPSEDGDLNPIKQRSGEMASKAKALKKSAIPTEYQKDGVKENLKLLSKESAQLHKIVSAKKTDAEISQALLKLHDRFHEVIEKCHH